MKIVITVPTYYPKTDGVAVVTKYLAEGLAKKGHLISVFTSNSNNLNCNETYNNVNIIRLNLNTKFGLYFGDKKKYVNLMKSESQKNDLIINICTQNAFTDLILKDMSHYKCKKILYIHGIFDFRFKKSDFNGLKTIINKLWKEIRWFFYYKNNKNYFKKYNKIIQLHENDYGNLFFKKKYNINSIIMENAADDSFFDKNNKLIFNKPFTKYVIYVANFIDNKNQRLAIKEFFLSNISKDIGLVLIGSRFNNYSNKLKKYENKYRKKYKIKEGEKPIIMLEKISRAQIYLYVKNSFLFLMTSKSEKYPMSLVESIAAGIPFITTNVGISKFLPGGFTVNNEKDIHKYITAVCNSKSIRSNLIKLGTKYANNKLKIEDKINYLNDIINKL